eukprot:TRINITY_DN4424_c0_g1::TRINITY_DN4424_c0_g1_i1::g.7346::m.7346 TRINITY_DN4424_c0_g1::TRINITY_DN4424_c0_g1_i1::g.7346  ORF type:complete len:110 (+),score=19.23,Med9/PF07544.8/5.5e+03,Med9/PF07544.8/0.001,Activator_LAG-3/PF11498.3/0.007,HisKA/PF00512.20/0.047,Med21/PF11221.3/0.036 TRINITY_DN4424_c0_g1_i1:92-421(+)
MNDDSQDAETSALDFIKKTDAVPLIVTALEKLANADEESMQQALLAIKRHFRQCEDIINNLPGGDSTHAQQQALYLDLLTKLEKKQGQIQKYLTLDVFQHLNNGEASMS